MRKLSFVLLLALALAACSPPRQVATITGRPIPPPSRSEPEEAIEKEPAPPPYEITAVGRFDDGKMWTFDAPPVEYFREEYGVSADTAWFRKARLGALRFSDNCSASFISARGLVMTNHHCAREHLVDVEKEGEDLMRDGFFASSTTDERKVKDLYVEQLIEMEDVSKEILKAAKDVPGAGPKAEARQKRAEAIENRNNSRLSFKKDNLKAEVVELHPGNVYVMYTYRKYPDVRLVFAPEEAIGYFGGDTDNFTYPRHTLDMSFFRVWEGEEPIMTTDFFQWDASGPEEGEAVFVVGNPGSTSRLSTSSQLEYLRDVEFPPVLEILQDRTAIIAEYVDEYREEADSFDVRNDLMAARNMLKAMEGQYHSLLGDEILSRAYSAELQMDAKIEADESLREEVGNLISDIALLQGSKKASSARAGAFYHFLNPAVSSPILTRAIYGYVYALLSRRGAPEDQLGEIFEEAMSIESWPEELEKQIIARRVNDLATYLGPTDPTMKRLLSGGTAEELADSLVQNTALGDSARYRVILEDNYLASGDATVDVINAIGPLYFTLDSELRSMHEREDLLMGRLSQVRYAMTEGSVPPDAEFTLRISDGRVSGYSSGMREIEAFTTFSGMFNLSQENKDEEEWDLPDDWENGRSSVDMDTPLNFVSTNDITGGSSGSAILNSDLEIVGLIFDGNLESLPNEYVFNDRSARSISVDARAIIESLSSIYSTDRLVLEILEGRYVETETEAEATGR